MQRQSNNATDLAAAAAVLLLVLAVGVVIVLALDVALRRPLLGVARFRDGALPLVVLFAAPGAGQKSPVAQGKVVV